MKIAAAYIRVSTDDQLEYSPDSQLEKIREYADKNGWILPAEYIFREDEGISGKKAEKRPEFMRMIGIAKQKPKPFDGIIVWKFSRFARNRQDSIVYKSMLRKQCGIEVVSVTEQLGDDKMSILVEAMIEAMDEYYSINLAEEVRRGMNEKVSRGEPVTAPAFGYRIEKKGYVVDPDTAPVVRMIFHDFIGGMGCRAIADKLNAMGIRTKRGGLWENRTVEYILRNPVYIGKIRWNPKGKTRRNFQDPNLKITDGAHEHLIDDETWQQAQNQFQRNKRKYGKNGGGKKPAEYPLQGLVRCESCGATLTRSNGTYMQCQAYAHGKCHVSHSISADKLEAMILSAIQETLRCRSLEIPGAESWPRQEEIQWIDRQIQREEQKLARIREAYENGIDSLEEYKEAKKKINARMEQLAAEKSAAETVNTQALSPMPPMYTDAVSLLRSPTVGPDVKNALLRCLLDKIVFDRKNNRIELYYSAL